MKITEYYKPTDTEWSLPLSLSYENNLDINIWIIVQNSLGFFEFSIEYFNVRMIVTSSNFKFFVKNLHFFN